MRRILAISIVLLIALDRGRGEVAAGQETDTAAARAVGQAYLDAIRARRWSDAARLVHSETLRHYRRRVVEKERCRREPEQPLTVEMLMVMRPGMPREVAEYELAQSRRNSEQSRNMERLEDRFDGVRSLAELERLSAEELLARAMSAQHRWMLQEYAGAFDLRAIATAAVLEGEWAYVLYWYAYELDEPDPTGAVELFRLGPRTLQLRPGADGWRLSTGHVLHSLGRGTLADGDAHALHPECGEPASLPRPVSADANVRRASIASASADTTALGVARTFLESLVAERFFDAAEWVHPETLAEFKRTKLEGYRCQARLPVRPATAEQPMLRDSTLPRAVAEYRASQFNSRIASVDESVAREFPGLRALAELEAATPVQLFALYLSSQRPHMMSWPAWDGSVNIIGGSIRARRADVLFRFGPADHPSISTDYYRPAPFSLRLRRSSEGWRIAYSAHGSLSGVKYGPGMLDSLWQASPCYGR